MRVTEAAVLGALVRYRLELVWRTARSPTPQQYNDIRIRAYSAGHPAVDVASGCKNNPRNA